MLKAFRWLLLVMLCALAQPATAVTEVSGVSLRGAVYRIAVPDGWREGGPLVLMQHGYSHEYVLDATLGPLRDAMLADGYAVAASGYRQKGWALFKAVDDNDDLVEIFRLRFDRPGAIYSVGGSMGGLIALKVAEDPRLRDRVRGVLALCPAAAGVQAWDTAFDIRVAYDAICRNASGNPLPTGDAPLPWALNLRDIPLGLGTFEPANQTLIQSMAAVVQCTGLGLPPLVRSSSQRDRLATLLRVTHIDDEDFLEANLGYAIFGLAELVRAGDKLNERNPFLNRNLEGELLSYGDATVDANIRRVEHDPFERLDFERSSGLSGTASARILAVTTSRDELTILQHLEVLRSVYPAAKVSTLVENSGSHCGFNTAELHATWKALIAPPNDTTPLNTRCAAEVDAGRAGPCRFFVNTIAASNDSFRTRHELLLPRATSSGLWFDPERSGEGIAIEELGGAVGTAAWKLPAAKRRVLVNWYTFAPPGDPNPGPRWMVGIGERTDSGVFVPSMTITRGARFGASFNPADVNRDDWGSLALVVDPTQRLRVRYDGPDAWSGSERVMAPLLPTELSQRAFEPSRDAGKITPPPFVSVSSASGSYFNPTRDGEGVQLVMGPSNNGAHTAVLLFYTYDPDGQQVWLVGTATVPALGGEVRFEMQRAEGTVFGDTFNAANVRRIPWGTVDIELRLSGNGFLQFYVADRLRFASIDPRYGSGGYALTRITNVGQ